MFEFIVVVLLLLMYDSISKRFGDNQIEPKPEQSEHKLKQSEHDVFVRAFDMDEFMSENNIRAFYCSHENRIYWVQNVEETVFCPNDSTLLYAC